jgi:hypothetical protein
MCPTKERSAGKCPRKCIESHSFRLYRFRGLSSDRQTVTGTNRQKCANFIGCPRPDVYCGAVFLASAFREIDFVERGTEISRIDPGAAWVGEHPRWPPIIKRAPGNGMSAFGKWNECFAVGISLQSPQNWNHMEGEQIASPCLSAFNPAFGVANGVQSSA